MASKLLVIEIPKMDPGHPVIMIGIFKTASLSRKFTSCLQIRITQWIDTNFNYQKLNLMLINNISPIFDVILISMKFDISCK